MKPKFLITFLLILGLETLILSFIFLKAFEEYRVLGAKDAINLNKQAFIKKVEGPLSGFYELDPLQKEVNLVNEPNPSWLVQKPNYTINVNGENDRFTYTTEKDPGIFRIVAIGDSFTFGLFLNTKDSYPEVLEDLLNQKPCPNIKKFEVINLGVPGYDIRYSVEHFKNHGQKYNPDMVLWLLKDDDYTETRDLTYQKSKELENDPQLKLDPGPSSVNIWAKAMTDVYKSIGKEGLKDYQRQALQSINDYFQNSLLMVTFNSTSQEPKTVFQEFAQKRPKTFFFDGLPDLYKLKQVLPDGHPNKEGAKTLASEITDYLLSKNIIPCKS